MDKRFLALLVVVCFALADAGCASKHVEYMEMPLQTGSVLHRRVAVESTPMKETKKETKKRETKRVEPEPEATPRPREEESTTPDRFR